VTEPFRVAVVGAGPAGLAAAVHAAGGGLTVVLVDAGARPGGQYWRHPDPALGADERAGHHDWKTFTALRAALHKHIDEGRVRYLARAQVVLLDPGPPFLLHLTPQRATPRRSGRRRRSRPDLVPRGIRPPATRPRAGTCPA
jgi:D-hydroxyproline dehydrogenase subunit alpha